MSRLPPSCNARRTTNNRKSGEAVAFPLHPCESDSIDQEWNAWYNGEYIPGYRKVSGVVYARRYRVAEGETRYTTVYEFEHTKVSEATQWNQQRETSSPNSVRMREVMTHAAGSPGVYRRIYPQ